MTWQHCFVHPAEMQVIGLTKTHMAGRGALQYATVATSAFTI
jgi:hypothetical protein